jgi:hypothetical protein
MTQTLKEIYSSNVDKRVYEALILSHPLFSKSYYLINDTEGRPQDVDGTVQSFDACPFRVSLPEKGSEQQDVELALPNIGWDIIKELDAAIEDIYTPIQVRFLVYIEDDLYSHAEIPNLEFTNINVDRISVTGIGMRKDLYGHYINENAIFDLRFAGLFI